MVGFRVVNKSSFTFETDLPPASRNIHPSGILHAFRTTVSPSTIKNSIGMVPTSQNPDAIGSGDNDDDDENESIKNALKLNTSTTTSISTTTTTEEHTFAWIQNTLHIETALSLFSTHGFQDSNTVFIPYSTKANWRTKYPHAEPAMECLDDGKCVVIMNWRPYPNALGEGGIRDALGAAGNGVDAADGNVAGGDAAGGDAGSGGKVGDKKSDAEIEKRNRRRYAARSKVNLFNDKNFIPDAERDELHVEIYNYLAWLKEKVGEVERREEEIEFERKVAAMVPPVVDEDVNDGGDDDGEGGGDGDGDNDEQAGGEGATGKKKSAAAVEKGGRKKTGIDLEELQGVLDKMEAAFYILPNAKLEAAEEEAAMVAVAAAEEELAASKAAEEEAAAVTEAAATEETSQQKRQRQEGEEEEEGEVGGDGRATKRHRGEEQGGEQEQGGAEAAGEPMEQGGEGKATTGGQPTQEAEGAAGGPDQGVKAEAVEPVQADKDAVMEQQPTQEEGIETSTEQPPNVAEANAEADEEETPPPPKESKPTFLESALSEVLFQKVLARDLAGMPKRRSRKRKRLGRPSAPQWQVEGFDEMFQRLKDYKEEHGTCAVPRNPRKTDEVYGKLSNWVNAIRNRRRTLLRDGIEHEDDRPGVRKRVLTKALTSERIRLLDSIGFVWSIAGPKAAWEDRFRELMEYYDANDRWPSQSMGKLGEWIHKQRMQYSKRDEKFMRERAPKLDAVGFEWNPRGYTRMSWDEGFEMLMEFGRINGHYELPALTPEVDRRSAEYRLHSWVESLHRLYRSYKDGRQSGYLTDERVLLLIKHGFEFRNY